MDGIEGQSGSDTAVFREQGKGLIKMFVATGAVIPPFAVVEEAFFTHDRKIFNDRDPVIMDFICKGAANGAGKRPSFEGKEDMDISICRRDIM